MQTIGDELVDSIVSDNIPVLAEDAKFNEAVTSSLRRIEVGQLPRSRACRDLEQSQDVRTPVGAVCVAQPGAGGPGPAALQRLPHRDHTAPCKDHHDETLLASCHGPHAVSQDKRRRLIERASRAWE